ncbi:hypothetical protein [Mesorhizobium sp. B3-1-9]|uniref:hypothetical protein n=1 Tax=Mesorhizobium sp. B3-1-9 TaxID=2589892 RepID=UPI0015E2B2E4|nr:hypothetical protein [Mesorhizobium sp. B3-1-9]
MAGERERIREIEQVLSGARSARDDIVVQSWMRRIDTHRLGTARPIEIYIVLTD